MRADCLRRRLLSDRGRAALTIDDIHALPDLAGWSRLTLDVAVGDLVLSGVLTDDAYGRIHVQPLAEAAA